MASFLYYDSCNTIHEAEKSRSLIISQTILLFKKKTETDHYWENVGAQWPNG